MTLIQEGLLRISRNPIYIGGVIMLSGLFLIIPNALTLLILIVGLVIIGAQVRHEEEHVGKCTRGSMRNTVSMCDGGFDQKEL